MATQKGDNENYPEWLKKGIKRLEAEGRKYGANKHEDGSFTLSTELVPEKDLSPEGQIELDKRIKSGERMLITDLDEYFAQFQG